MGETIRVCCAILMDNNQVLCAQRSASMPLPYKWEFPGGKIEKEEDPEHALLREIREELGVEIEVLRKFGSNFHQYSGAKQIELIPFLGRIIEGEPYPKEHESLIWVRPENLASLDWAEADIPIVDEFVKWFERTLRA
jgi:8-oxo-dGTP diphosphatase